jgi:hypothetical protein
MQNLRLLGVSDDGSRLLLEGPDGADYALPLDERVHAAMRGDRARLGQLQIELENQLTPREIQARIRAGQTSEEIAVASQVPVERIRRFEGPVLQERWHIAELAKTTNVRRVTDASAHPMSDLVVERLAARGVDTEVLEWDARRREDGRWAVRLDYSHGGRERSATWLFDHQRRTLEPHDDEASWLTADERAVPEPSRATRGRSRTSDKRPAGAESTDATGPAASAESSETRPRAEKAPRLTAVPDVRDDDPEAEPDAVVDPSAGEMADEAPAWADDDLADSLDSFDDSDQAGEPETPEVVVERDNPQRPPTSATPPRGRRAAVPSWDEILFGTSSPED